jgi:hypothetical protein
VQPKRVTTPALVRFAGRLCRWACATLLVGPAVGCSQLWDDLTAQSPEGGFGNNMAYRYHLLFHRPEPLQVLAESQDGDMRRRALMSLRESKDPKEQDMLLNLLAAAAKTERDTVCRLAAVEKLGEFNDPRATAALTEAFYAPANFGERNPVVRMGVLRSLGQRKDPAAVQLLTEAVARDPSMDVRIAAAEALGHFPNASAAGTLVRVLREEKDVALRYQASQSLTKITGKELPARADEWDSYLRTATRPDGSIARSEANPLIKLASWWE